MASVLPGQSRTSHASCTRVTVTARRCVFRWHTIHLAALPSGPAIVASVARGECAGLRCRRGRLESTVGLGRYRFSTATADFLFCTRCGQLAAAVSHHAGQLLAVVNIDMFDDADEFPPSTPAHLVEETVDSRLDRRSRNWMPIEVLEPPNANAGG